MMRTRMSLCLCLITCLQVSCDLADSRSAVFATPMNSPQQSQGDYTVTFFKRSEWDYEGNKAPNDGSVNSSYGVAPTEQSELFPGTCPDGKDSQGRSVPNCSANPDVKGILGKTVYVSYNGKTVKAFISGICPEKHWNNAQKGSANPCMRGRKHVDIDENLYRNGLGLSDGQSYGSGTQAKIGVTYNAAGTVSQTAALGNSGTTQSSSSGGNTGSTKSGNGGTSSSTNGSQSSGSGTPSLQSASSGGILNCSGNSFCLAGWGWLSDGQSGCSAANAGWRGNGCSCTCNGTSGGGTTPSQGSPNTQPQTQSSTTPPTGQTAPSSGGYPSCGAGSSCNGGWGWMKEGENGCSSGSAGWKGNGCSCTCSSSQGSTAQPQQQASSGSGGTLTCSGNKYCSGGWGWLTDGESGCSSGSAGWKGNGCSCTCN